MVIVKRVNLCRNRPAIRTGRPWQGTELGLEATKVERVDKPVTIQIRQRISRSICGLEYTEVNCIGNPVLIEICIAEIAVTVGICVELAVATCVRDQVPIRQIDTPRHHPGHNR